MPLDFESLDHAEFVREALWACGRSDELRLINGG